MADMEVSETDQVNDGQVSEMETDDAVKDSKENNEAEKSISNDTSEVESSVDVLGLLSEAVSRNRNDSDEELEADDEDARSPESLHDQQDESCSNDAVEEGDLTATGEDSEYPEQEQELELDADDNIDINEDFVLHYDSENEETTTVLEGYTLDNDVVKPDVDKPETGVNKSETGVDKPETGVDKIETSVDKPETGVDKPETGVDKPETGVNKPGTGVDKPEIDVDKSKTDVSAESAEKEKEVVDNEMEIDLIPVEMNDKQKSEKGFDKLLEKNDSEKVLCDLVSQELSQLKSIVDSRDTIDDDKPDAKRLKLSNDMWKSLKKEALKFADGEVCNEDVDKLSKELENAMKSIFQNMKTKESVPEEPIKSTMDESNLKSVDETTVEKMDLETTTNIDTLEKTVTNSQLVIDLSDDEKELKTVDSEKVVESLPLENNIPQQEESSKVSDDKVAENKTPSSNVLCIVDLDGSSSDSEDIAKVKLENKENATTVSIPSSIDVISSSTTNNSEIKCTENSGVSVISGLPNTPAKPASAMRINTAEITISTIAKTSENESSLNNEVLNLDSDDESSKLDIHTEPKEKKEEKMDVGNVDNVSSLNSAKPGWTCVNPTCQSKPESPLTACPIFIVGMLKIKRTRGHPHPKICQKCLDYLSNEMAVLINEFRLGKPLINTEISSNDELVEILDSDSDIEDKDEEFIPLPGYDPLPDEELEFVINNLPDMMEEVCKKYKFNEQIETCTKLLNERIKKIETTVTISLEEDIKELQSKTNFIRDSLYNTVKFERSYLPEFIVPSEFDDETKAMEFYNDDGNNGINNEAAAEVPPPGVFTLPRLEIGSSVYTVKHSIFGAWIPAFIVDISPVGTPMANGMPLLFSLLTIRFYLNANQKMKQVTGRQVAYSEPSKVRYPMGTRVIALFKDNSTMVKKDAFYSGVIAESPSQLNSFRYLVFFDDGYAQYVLHKNILPVSESSNKVWEDVHPDSRDFVRKYLSNYPERPMVRMQPGQILKTERNGSWWDARVKELDASLALLQFEGTNKMEWIYRGSTRLLLLYQQVQAVDRRALAPGRHRPGTTANNTIFNASNTPYVEYTRPQDQELPTISIDDEVSNTDKLVKPQRAVAKKSTSTICTPKVQDFTPEVMDPAANIAKSRVVYYSPKVWVHPEKMVPHTCGPQCLNPKTIALSSLRTYNPLARPLLSAWERLLIKYRYKRIIMYRAPCGRRLRNIEEVHQYLLMTGSEMSVDLFDFDYRVHCLAEFVLIKHFANQVDVSHGKEAVPVPCVNYYNGNLPEFWEYSNKRQATNGVDLNLDENFLCGCDCTDDCQDKEKCQCWQLTFEGTRFVGLRDENVGYQYKRLLDQVPTGIYECNSRCKCAATCLNRVVQHPLQLKLQVFQTVNKGWGIRALNDIPRGCFICIYAGSLLTDAVANDDGKKRDGDKYLADLDYIEVVERLKEGYEADVPEEDRRLNQKPYVAQESDEDNDNDGDDEDDDFTQATSSLVRSDKHYESDEEFNPTYIPTSSNDSPKEIKTRLRVKQMQNQSKELNVKKNFSNVSNIKTEPGAEKVVTDQKKGLDIENQSRDKTKDNSNQDMITISDDEEVIREPSRFTAPEGCEEDEYVPRYRSVRSFFGSDEACFIMDARVTGNIGRYLNHSCSPNVFVQNVFVDTHDPRFPWVAFFALMHVRAGTELTWNYNYDIGSVPGKIIYCHCGAPNCRGRLL